MNLDTSDSLLPDTSYREAFNLRLTTGTDGNTGALHNIEGVEFFQNIAVSLPSLGDGQSWGNIKVVHTDSIRRYGIVFVTASTGGYTKYFIFRFINKDELLSGEDGNVQLIFGPCDTPLSDSLSTISRWEDADNIKIYYADGTQPLRVINISPQADATREKTNDGAFSIYPTALLSQPKFSGFTNGNLKVGAYQYGYQLSNKNGAETEISPLTNMIYVTGSTLSPSSETQVNGSAKGESSGKSINITIGINDQKYDRLRIVSVYYEDTTNIPVITVLKDAVLQKNADGLISDITFQAIDNIGISTMTLEEFNLLTSIHFVPKLLESKNNFLFASDIKYQDNTFEVEYDARSYGSCLESPNNALITVLDDTQNGKIIADNHRICAGEIDVIKEHDCINPFSIIENNYSSYIQSYVPGSDTSNLMCALTTARYGEDREVVYGGSGINIRYKFIVAEIELNNPQEAVKSVNFEGVWVSDIKYDGTPIRQRFLKLTDKKRILPTYANEIIQNKLKTLQRDELYRYGIVFYNKFNQASSVKWIADIRVPAVSIPGFETFSTDKTVSYLQDGTRYVAKAVARVIGLEFEVVNMPDGALAYEIVRCKRTESDRATITQGLIGTTFDPRDNPISGRLYASNLMTSSIGCIYAFNYAGTIEPGASITYEQKDENFIEASYDQRSYLLKNMTDRVLQFASPEICYNYEFMKGQLPSNGLDLQMINFLFPGDKTYSGSDIKTIPGKLSFLKYRTSDPISGQQYDMQKPFAWLNASKRLPNEPIKEPVSNVVRLTNQAPQCVGLSPIVSGFPPFGTGGGRCTAGDSSEILDIAFPAEGNWDKFQNRFDYVDAVGSVSYNNWVTSSFTSAAKIAVGFQGYNGRCVLLRSKLPGGIDAGMYFQMAVGSRQSKKPIDTSINAKLVTEQLSDTTFYNDSVLGTMLCNVRKKTIPYGGYGYNARQFNTYGGIGGYSTNTSTSLSLFAGDTYICNFEYKKMHYAQGVNSDGAADNYTTTATTTYTFPVETAININLKSGAQVSSVKSQLQPSNVEGSYVQDKPLYVYNSVYSVEPSVRLFTPETLYDEYNKHVDTRTVFSLNKNNDEIIDSWTKFKPLNYLDVDSRYGSLTNLRTFGNELLYWQENAVGKFSVNERTLINDDSNAPLLLGTGGTLSRYDYLATVNGMKLGHKDSDCQSDHVLYWYDYDKHELCQYSNGNVICLSKVKYVQSYLNNLDLTKSEQAAKPILTFDKYYNEVIATLSKSESLVYSENAQIFTGFYNIVPDYNLYFNSNVYFVKNNKIYQYNADTVNSGFEDQMLPIELNYIVNRDYLRTKVYDNIEFTGYLAKDSVKFEFVADGAVSKPLITSGISNREYDFRGAVPRHNSTELFGNRMRGRVLYCKMTYRLSNVEGTNIITIKEGDNMQTIVEGADIITNNGEVTSTADRRFELPYVRTTYRISRN